MSNRSRAGQWAALAASVVLVMGCGPVRTDRVVVSGIPAWALDLRSDRLSCIDAAAEAKARALAMGIAADRLQWLYGLKPFSEAGHVSLVVDGKYVVDNGGLGRDVWGRPVCAGDVCTLEEARRAYDDCFLEPAAGAPRREFGEAEWSTRSDPDAGGQ